MYALIFWAFFVLFMKLPVWVRVPFLLWSAFKLLRAIVRPLFRAFDREPDFILSSGGIGGWDRTAFRFIPWPDVSKVTIVTRQHKIWGYPVDSPQQLIELEGPEVGPRRFFDTLPPRRIRIYVAQTFLPIRSEDIIATIRRHRADLLKEYDARSSVP